VNVSNVSLGGQKFRPNDKNGGMKSHDHEVQWGVESGGKGRRKQRPMSRNLELWGN
jgi:hypothetical protein